MRSTIRIAEANVQVGTIVWTGAVMRTANATMIVDERTARNPATACERATTIHAVLAIGAVLQTVPYREINCQGMTSTGELRVAHFSSDGTTFDGSFWSDGAKLGNFTSTRG